MNLCNNGISLNTSKKLLGIINIHSSIVALDALNLLYLIHRIMMITVYKNYKTN